jgi:hypothetical protein
MCPFCVATAAWIAAGAVSMGGASVLAVAKLRLINQRARERGEEEGHDEQ